MSDGLVKSAGNPWADEHLAGVTTAAWRSFASCSCGWRGRSATYFSGPDPFTQQLFGRISQEANAEAHHRRMNGLRWRILRAIRESWFATLEAWGKGPYYSADCKLNSHKICHAYDCHCGCHKGEN